MTITDAPPYDPTHDEPPEEQTWTTTPRPTPPRTTTASHDLEAEAGVLGCMLNSLQACDDTLATNLEPHEFYSPAHADIYQAILTVALTGTKPDPVTVDAALPRGTPATRDQLITLLADAPVYTNARVYAQRVRTLARLRHLQGAAAEISDAARSEDLDRALNAIARATAELPEDTTETSWRPIDLTQAIEGHGPPQPAFLTRQDGLKLLYPGKVHAINAESESGKSWLALHAATERLHTGETVLYLDYEDDPASIVSRLQALGATNDAITDRFIYLRPDDPIDQVATAHLDTLCKEHRPSLAVIDGVTEVMSQNGWSINDNDDTATFLLALPRRIARHGAAVVLIDHVTKDRESRGRYAIGAQHKLAGIDGAAYTLEVTEPFGIGRSGASRITCIKDRPGWIRGHIEAGKNAGHMHVISDGTGTVQITITDQHQKSETQVRPTTLMEHLASSLAELNDAGVEPTSNALLTTVRGNRRFLQIGLRELVEGGWVEQRPGANRAKHHRLIKPYRADEDPHAATRPNHPDPHLEDF